MGKERFRLSNLKSTYMTQVEDKYVFNVSLIFWHFFIALSTLLISVSFIMFLWSIIPATVRDVEKKPYPAKRQYPSPVKVALNELQLDGTKEDAPPVVQEPVQTTSALVQQPVEDTKGKGEYDASLNILKTLIPPTKYSWQGAGFWTYPNGERYWNVYKQEKYRKWVSTEAGLEDKLKSAGRRAKAEKYPDRKLLLDGYISVLKLLPEEKRMNALQNMLNNTANNISQNLNTCQSLCKVVGKIPKEGDAGYIGQLFNFGERNPNDGPVFIDYLAEIIDKFNISKRTEIIDRLVNGYYSYFNRNISMLKEATDLFIPMIPQIKVEDQIKAITKYYGVFRNKNYIRDNSIAQIEFEHEQAVNEIESSFRIEQSKAEADYLENQISKGEYRYKSLVGIGGGIMLIVLIAVVLVFFSIQRSVKKIESKIVLDGESQNIV